MCWGGSWNNVLSKCVLTILVGAACLAQEIAPAAVEEAVAPVYPGLAVLGRISGSVIVDARVSERGAVSNAAAAEGEALLRQPSLDAARLWRFRAQPGEREVKLIFSFRLMPKNTPEAELGAIFRPPYTVEVRKITPGPVSHVARNGSGVSRQAAR
jgi:hypothetical protein